MYSTEECLLTHFCEQCLGLTFLCIHPSIERPSPVTNTVTPTLVLTMCEGMYCSVICNKVHISSVHVSSVDKLITTVGKLLSDTYTRNSPLDQN